jgi:DNA processing protein
MDATTTRQLLALQHLLPLHDVTLSRALQHLGGVGAAWSSDWSSWPGLGISRLSPARLSALQRDRETAACTDPVAEQLGRLQRSGAAVLPITDPGYPPLLLSLYDPPPVLYLRGRVGALHEATLAVVGSRRASAIGLRLAERLSAEAGSAGLAICSGLALGIDGAALRGTLRAGATGVAVMATGVDRVHPQRHRALAEALLPDGCLVSELPPGTPPLRHHFPRRNRIISGLSLGVLVVEAALPSGSLITANAAAEQGREVFALPWSPGHPGGAGCLRLIRDGATLVETVDDILAELGPVAAHCHGIDDLAARSAAGSQLAGTPVAGTPVAGIPVGNPMLLDLLGAAAVTVDELALHTGWPVERVLSELSVLELGGQVERSGVGYFRR